MGKTLLVVGAGFGQVPAIVKAEKNNVRVVTVDKNPDAPGMNLAQFSYEIDVLDKEAILEVAKKHGVDGIMTLQSDFGVPAVGFVNDCLELMGISYETAINCSDKIKCRAKLTENECPQPAYEYVQDINEARRAIDRIGLPSVVKTPDSSASRGVIKVSHTDELENALITAFKYSDRDYVLVEEFIDGLEFGAQTFSVKGECELVLMHNDTLSKPPNMIPVGHSFPLTGQEGDWHIKAVENIKKAVVALGIIDGPANVDLILDKRNGEVNIIEIGARIGATCLPELVKYHTGIDWIGESIKSALGLKPDLTVKKNRPVAALIIQSPRDGIYQRYSMNSDPQDFNVVEYEITANYGDKVYKLRNGTDRIGKVVTYGKNAQEAESNAKRFAESLNIEVC